MIQTLFVNEWRNLIRDGRALMILSLGALLAVVAAWSAASTDSQERLGQTEATESAREAWLDKEADNPHSRAHFGDYVFRPSGPLAGLDSGLQRVTGRVVRVEAHRQSTGAHIPHREASSLLRFDRLEPSTVLILLVPLILVLVGFGTIASERESGRLRLLRVQGASPAVLLLAKSLALWSVGAALTLVVLGAHSVFTHEAPAPAQTLLYLLLHLAALWIVAALVVCVSSWSRRPGTAAAVLLCLWVAGALVLPRLAAMTANATFPLPGRDAFETAMREDREKGIDGHNPYDARSLEIEQKALQQYGVATKEELPVNLDGLLMQADEEYGDRVWDQHFGALEERLQRQSALAGAFAFVNPLQATDRISMALAGTDLTSHLAFLEQTERHRRSFVKLLNDEQAYGGSKTDDWAWKAEPEFYASFEPFRFEPPPLREVLAGQAPELTALVLWGLGLTGLLFYSARRLELGASP